MPDRQTDADAPTADARTADHASIDRLATDLLPALVAKLSATGLGEIEVREGDWKVRLRRPADIEARRRGGERADRPSRSQPGHAGHGHAPGALEGHRSMRPAVPSGNGTSGSAGVAVGPGHATGGHDPDYHRSVAVSPAVGVFQPRPDATAGTRVRAGDRIGHVDMLGVPHEVVAPVDGILGATLVEAGEAVEYGQDLVAIELVGRAPAEGATDTSAANDGAGG